MGGSPFLSDDVNANIHDRHPRVKGSIVFSPMGKGPGKSPGYMGRAIGSVAGLFLTRILAVALV
jgi:hypothetical protein